MVFQRSIMRLEKAILVVRYFCCSWTFSLQVYGYIFKGALRVLLDFSPQLAEKNCWSPLFYASLRGDFDLSYLLLTFGVNPNLIDEKTGTGILHEAVRYENKSEPQPNPQRLKIIRYLTMYGGNPELKNSKKEVEMSFFYEDQIEDYFNRLFFRVHFHWLIKSRKPRHISIQKR